MIAHEQLTDIAETGGHRLVDGAGIVTGRFLLEMRDAQRVSAPDLAVVGLNLAAQHAQQRRLAGAVAAEQTDALAGVDLEIDARQQRVMAVSQ